jgi:hypothetical protein
VDQGLTPFCFIVTDLCHFGKNHTASSARRRQALVGWQWAMTTFGARGEHGAKCKKSPWANALAIAFKSSVRLMRLMQKKESNIVRN